MKERREYTDIHEARRDREGTGGWFFENEQDKRAFWFDMQHTPTEILMQVKGNGMLGLFSTWGPI